MYIPSFSELRENCSFTTIDNVIPIFPGISFEMISEAEKFNSKTNLSMEKSNPVVDGIILGRANPLTPKNCDLFGLSLVELESTQRYIVPFFADCSKKKVLLDDNFGFKTCANSISDLSGLEKIVSDEKDVVDKFGISRKNFPSQYGLFSASLFSTFALSPFAGVGIFSLGIACSGVIGFGDAVNDFKKKRENYYKNVFEEVKSNSLRTY